MTVKPHKDLAFIINFSGGKDSTAMLAHLCERYPTVKKYVVHADTGFEHVKPISAADFSRTMAARFGLELNITRNPNKTFQEMVARRGMFPAPKYRQCTSDLKRGPIETWIRNHVSEKHIINCMGIRAEESANRAKQPVWKRHLGLSKAGRKVWSWNPIHHWTLEEILEFHRTRDLPLHPVYTWAGGYLRRLSCRVCIFMTDADLRAVSQHDPEAIAIIDGLEKQTGFTMKQERSILEILQ